MNMRGQKAGVFLSLSLLAGSVSAAGPMPSASPAGPVLIFLVDTLRPDRMSVYGAPHATTPASADLAREGVVFDRAYAHSSWTRASVGTLFTSLLPAAAGTLDRNGLLDPAVATLPQLFHDRGFKTAAFVGNVNVSKRTGFGRGFDVFESVEAVEPGLEASPRARTVVDPAVRFVESQQSSRFFLYVHVMDPHQPLNLEPASRALFAEATADPKPDPRQDQLLDYDRGIRQADDQFARLVAALRTKGFWDHATVIYTSDHGEEFYEHGGRGHGDTLFEEQIRVPLILKLPIGRGTTSRRQELVSLADVVPTLSELYGLRRDASWIGSSLLVPLPVRPLYFTEDVDGNRLYAIRAGTRKLVVNLYPKLEERLYDLSRDAGEKQGTEIACGEPLPEGDRGLFAALETWRFRDVSGYPRIDFEKSGAGAVRFILTMALPDSHRTFLTFGDYCRCRPYIRATAFILAADVPASEAYRLSVATDAQGSIPTYRLAVYDASGSPVTGKRRDALFRSLRVERPRLSESESEDEIKKLRNLGYLGGAPPARQRP